MPELPWSALIVTHNSQRDVRNCLDSLKPWTEAGRAEVVVVDNASSDRTVEVLKTEYPWVVTLPSAFNGGYAAGINRAAAQASGDFLFILNPDCQVHPNCPEILIQSLRTHPSVAVAAPCILDAAGRKTLSHFPFTTLALALWGATGLHRLLSLNRTDGRWELARRQPPDRPVRVERVLGAAMMVRREAFFRVGGMDESFFLYSEEEDLCFRLRRLGWEILYQPAALVTHSGAGSTGATNPLAVASSVHSRILFLRKHYGRTSAAVAAAVWAVGLGVRTALSLPFHPFSRIAGYWFALRSALDSRYFEKNLRPPRPKENR